MQRGIKVQVHIGKDHLVRFPSEIPEGPAEVIVIPRARAPESSEVAAKRREALGRYEGQGGVVAADFDAPLSEEMLAAFEGEDE
jgi:hypothetical protein